MTCACMGPQRGEPLCPCAMQAARAHIVNDFNRWTPPGREVVTPDDPVPCVSTALHWLGDRRGAEDTAHALDMRGCVLYFATDSDCQKFMGWLTRQAVGALVGTGAAAVKETYQDDPEKADHHPADTGPINGG